MLTYGSVALSTSPMPAMPLSDAGRPTSLQRAKPVRSGACQVPDARNAWLCSRVVPGKEGFLSLTEQTRSEATNAQDSYDFGRGQRADGFRRPGAGRYVAKTAGGDGAESRSHPA